MRIGQRIVMDLPKSYKGKKATIISKKIMWKNSITGEWGAHEEYRLDFDGALAAHRKGSGNYYWFPQEAFICSGDGHAGSFSSWLKQKHREGINGI